MLFHCWLLCDLEDQMSTSKPLMSKDTKSLLGLVLGVIVCIVFWFLPLQGLSPAGQKCLALTLMTVVFWAMQITQPGYVSGLYLVLLVIFGVADSSVVFKSWVGPTMWLVVGAYLIATAVKTSGLGERIAYNYMYRFVTDYKSIILGIFVLTFVLSLLIPHPWPRAFLIMSVMAIVIKSSAIPKADAIKIGFAVFAASVPISLIFLTGDAVINPLAVQASGLPISFIEWFKIMGAPSVICSILTLILFLVLFRPEQEVNINKESIKEKIDGLGKLTTTEKKVTFWLIVAVLLWLTDFLHGVNIGWVTLLVGILMAMPKIGGCLKPTDWSAVPMQVLIFLTAAIAIGVVGGATGMNEWIAQTLLPSTAPSNIFFLAAFITLIAIIIHMLLGSVIAVMGVAIPAILLFTSSMGLNPIVPTMLVYMAIASHYLLPFQHLNILVGASEDTGGYTQKETLKLGIPLTAIMFIVNIAICVPWWKVIGLL